jgi:hypothetical protein
MEIWSSTAFRVGEKQDVCALHTLDAGGSSSTTDFRENRW